MGKAQPPRIHLHYKSSYVKDAKSLGVCMGRGFITKDHREVTCLLCKKKMKEQRFKTIDVKQNPAFKNAYIKELS